MKADSFHKTALIYVKQMRYQIMLCGTQNIS